MLRFPDGDTNITSSFSNPARPANKQSWRQCYHEINSTSIESILRYPKTLNHPTPNSITWNINTSLPIIWTQWIQTLHPLPFQSMPPTPTSTSAGVANHAIIVSRAMFPVAGVRWYASTLLTPHNPTTHSSIIILPSHLIYLVHPTNQPSTTFFP